MSTVLPLLYYVTSWAETYFLVSSLALFRLFFLPIIRAARYWSYYCCWSHNLLGRERAFRRLNALCNTTTGEQARLHAPWRRSSIGLRGNKFILFCLFLEDIFGSRFCDILYATVLIEQNNPEVVLKIFHTSRKVDNTFTGIE